MDGSDLEARENEGCVAVNERKNRQRSASPHDIEVGNRAARRARCQGSMNPSEDSSEDEVCNNDPDFNDPRKAAGARETTFREYSRPLFNSRFLLEPNRTLLKIARQLSPDAPGYGMKLTETARAGGPP